MSDHFRSICKHGVLVTQCRCPGSKVSRVVECPVGCFRRNEEKKSVRTDLEFHNDLLDVKSFESWAASKKEHPIGEGVRRYTATVIQVNEGRYAEEDSYGGSYWDSEAPQGWEGEAALIFEIRYFDEGEVVLHFKKFGTVSSYYDTRWDGKWVRVFPKKKEVVSYEFE